MDRRGGKAGLREKVILPIAVAAEFFEFFNDAIVRIQLQRRALRFSRMTFSLRPLSTPLPHPPAHLGGQK